MLLRRHNLNLLPILRELLRTCSVSQTARNIGLSQSAVSAALANLREIFGDEILYLEGRSLTLTERGKALIDATERASVEVEALFRPLSFDPQHEPRHFVIATADYGAVVLAPPLTAALTSLAPGTTIQFVDVPVELEKEMISGKIDLVVAPASTLPNPPVNFQSMPLFSDELVVIHSSRPEFMRSALTETDYRKARHAVFKIAPATSGFFESHGKPAGSFDIDRAVIVQQYSALPAIVESSDCIALIHRRVANRFIGSFDIAIRRLPFEAPAIDICAYWPRAFERDPAHSWFRQRVMEARPSRLPELMAR